MQLYSKNNTRSRTNSHKNCSKQPTIYKWLKDRTNDICIGRKWDGHPIHLNQNEDVIIGFKTKWRYGKQYMKTLMYDQHFDGSETYYFTGATEGKKKLTLFCIDIDNHKGVGTLEGALAYADYLKNSRFPNLYFEPSTNGAGVHAYVVFEKGKLDGKTVNDLLKRLQQDLQRELKTLSYAVEHVEIKGTCPVMVWGQNRGELASYTAGMLCKLPRDKGRFDELQKTTVLSHRDLLKLPPSERKKNTTMSGSISGKLITTTELLNLDYFEDISKRLMGSFDLRTTSRAKVTSQDVAIFLLIGKWMSNNMLADGSLPTARFAGMWNSLFEAGDVQRAFDCHRFTIIRNFLSSLGLLDWEDSSYVAPIRNTEGEIVVKGRAAKWKFSFELMISLDVKGEKASLVGTLENKHEIDAFINIIKQSEPIVPIEIYRIDVSLIDADQLTPKISFFEVAA